MHPGSSKSSNQLLQNYYDAMTLWTSKGSFATFEALMNVVANSLTYGGHIYLSILDSCALREALTREPSTERKILEAFEK